MKFLLTLIFVFLFQPVLAQADRGLDVQKEHFLPETIDEEMILRKVKDFIKEGGSLSATNSQGDTPLHILIQFSEPQGYIEILLKKQPNLSIRNNQGQTPLDLARKVGNEHVIQLLEEATQWQHKQVMDLLKNKVSAKELIEKKVRVDALNKEGQSPLHVLSYESGEGSIKAIETLVEAGADKNAIHKEATPLHVISAISNEIKLIELLVTKENINIRAGEKKNTPLHLVVRYQRVEFIKELLKYGAMFDIKNNEGKTALDLAEESGNKEIIEIFNDAKEGKIKQITLEPSPRTSDHAKSIDTALPESINKQTAIKKVHEFIQAGGDVNATNSSGDTATHILVRFSEEAEFLNSFEKDLNLNIQNEEGQTPLHLAVRLEKMEFLKIMLKKDINPLLKDEKGQNLLDIAKETENEELIKIIEEVVQDAEHKEFKITRDLIEKSSVNELRDSDRDFYARDLYRQTFLHVFTQEERVETVQKFLQVISSDEAMLNAKDSFGETALMMAISQEHIELIKIFLKEKFDFNIKNEYYHSLLDIAKETENKKVIKLIEEVNLEEYQRSEEAEKENVLPETIDKQITIKKVHEFYRGRRVCKCQKLFRRYSFTYFG